MARQINSPKENVASSAILIVQNAVTKMKEIIVSDIANGVSKEETTKKLNQIIAEASGKIGSFDADLAEEARTSLVISCKKWYYQYSVNTRVLNTAVITDFRNKIVEYQQGTGMSQTNRLYTIDINALSKELTGANNSNSIRTVLDKFRPYLKESNKGLAIIDNYQQMVRDQVKVLASDPPISNRIRQDGQPYKVSLRNRAEMKVRYEANQEDINNLKGEGVKLVWTSSHADASPRCAPYQGRLWSLDGSSGTINGEHYEPIENATAGPYGDGNGIISGYSCRHRLIEYEAGSKSPHDFSEAEIKKAYAIDQKQRSYENQIRQLKTEETLLRANENTVAAHEKRMQWQNLNKRYEAYSHENGRAYYPWRTRIADEEKDYNITNQIKNTKFIIPPTEADVNKFEGAFEKDFVPISKYVLTDERQTHIYERHPEVKGLENEIKEAILNPNYVFKDESTKKDGTKVVNTANIIKIGDINLFVTVKFISEDDKFHRFSSIMSARVMRDKNIKKYLEKNESNLIYKKNNK